MDASETCDTAQSKRILSPVRPAWPSFSVSSSCIISSISLPIPTCGRHPPESNPCPPGWWRNASANVKGLAHMHAHTSSVNDTIQTFAKPEFSSLQLHPKNSGPAVPRWKPSFYVYRFVLLFFLWYSIHPPERERETDRERRPRRGFTKLDARSEDGSKTRKRPRRLSPAFLSQLRSGSHNQPSFCVFLLFFCSFLTLSAANITSSCTPTIITTNNHDNNNQKAIPIRN